MVFRVAGGVLPCLHVEHIQRALAMTYHHLTALEIECWKLWSLLFYYANNVFRYFLAHQTNRVIIIFKPQFNFTGFQKIAKLHNCYHTQSSDLVYNWKVQTSCMEHCRADASPAVLVITELWLELVLRIPKVPFVSPIRIDHWSGARFYYCNRARLTIALHITYYNPVPAFMPSKIEHGNCWGHNLSIKR